MQTDKRKANSIEEMQAIAQNQVQWLLWKMEEQMAALTAIDPTAIVGWATYQEQIKELDLDFSVSVDLDALKELGEYYETMKDGNYF